MDSAIESIRKSARTETDSNKLLKLGQQLSALPISEFEKAGFIFKKLAVLSNYTSQLLIPLIKLYAADKKIHLTVYESEYGLAEHDIYSQNPSLLKFAPDLCYFCVGLEHLGSGPVPNEASRWINLWQKTHEWLGCEIIQNVFDEPMYRAFGSFEIKNPQSRLNFVRDLNRNLVQGAPPYVHFNDTNFLASYFGKNNWRDERLFDVSKIPISLEFLPQYANSIASVIAAIYGKTKKWLVVDLDNTLWGGVVGDDGLANIKIGDDSESGEAFKRLQLYIKDLKACGVILVVCSKNDLETAKEPFLKRTDMILKLSDFSHFVANWKPKPENIKQISDDLGIGLDSMVFLDDNPAEREIVRQSLPEVEVVELGSHPEEYLKTLATGNYFDLVRITEEDLKKTEQYQANTKRVEHQSAFVDYTEYLMSLKMKAVMAPFDKNNLPRITQLINKTNQFNLTTRRYSESEIKDFSGDEKVISRYIKLKDQFGDNGLISAFFGKITGKDIFEIDTWVMSCRVLKRSVEFLLFKSMVEELGHKNIKIVKGLYIPTAKNGLVAQLFSELGFQKESTLENKSELWTFDLTSLEQLKKQKNQLTPIQIVTEDVY